MGNLTKTQLLLMCVPLILAKITGMDRCPKMLHKKCRCCLCPDGEEIMIECVGLNNVELEAAAKSINKSELCVFSLRNAGLHEINQRVIGDHFKAATINLDDVGATYLDLFDAFHSMEDSLYELRLLNVYSPRFNVNDSGRNFKQLRNFQLADCSEMPNFDNVNVTSVVPRLPKHLYKISINKCKVTSLETNFFTRFTNLLKLDLSDNQLKYVRRSYLPRPANIFSSYNLSFNPIISLPEDMFEDMPALKEVSLQSTNIRTLPYHIFKPVLKQLKVLTIADIPLNCLCNAAWLLMNLRILTENSETTKATKCLYPYSLRNRELDTLIPIDMCMNCDVFLLKDTTYNEETTHTTSYTTECT